ncbi:hypothetical protein PIB30_040081 [Stylosanthes scabra]|uniref:Uncharacterized protein n=1 Tax=Stylosanthes scabra TaxID=79078 RepID=A0ABU6YGH3_9FABA|nr:hypothetical protein [Stylosanthes scabra]
MISGTHPPRSVVSLFAALNKDLYVQARTADPKEYHLHRAKSSIRGNHLMWTRLLLLSVSKYPRSTSQGSTGHTASVCQILQGDSDLTHGMWKLCVSGRHLSTNAESNVRSKWKSVNVTVCPKSASRK